MLKNKLKTKKIISRGKNVKIEKGAFLIGNCTLGNNVVIKSGSKIINSKIGDNTTIDLSVVEDSCIGKNNQIGPFSRIRPNTTTCDNVTLGNFVEIKNSFIGKNCKASHLSYVGDAILGENINVGCGVIFANYNGKIKQKIKVGNNVFIGSNTNIIAPVEIGDDVYICAGSNITENVPSGSFVVGRVRQEIKPGRAKDYLKK